MRHFSFCRPKLTQSIKVALLLTASIGISTVKAHEYSALIDAKKYAEVESAVAAKLASEPNNADALLANIDLILLEGNIKRFDGAIKLAEQCIQYHPKSSVCHESLGNVLGAKAEKGDMMAVVGSLGTIRDSFKTAIELDPTNYDAAVSLLSFYLEVPGLMGGSTANAKKLIRATEKTNPEFAKLLQAKFDLHDEDYEKASLGALAVNANNSPVINKLQRDLLVEIGLNLNKEKQFIEAEKVFLAVIKRNPDAAPAYLGLGRSLLEQGKPQDALLSLENSLRINATAGVHYRLGQTWQALGDEEKAVACYEQALAFTPALSARAREDADAQLETLKNSGFGTK